MNNLYYLSDDEIAVLSSLMDGNIIYGIESKLFQSYQQSYHDTVKKTLDRLREKQIIRLDYDGKMHIQKDIYQMITILTQPEHLLRMQTTLFSGEKELNYYYKQQDILHIKKGQQFHQLEIIEDMPEIIEEALDIDEHLTKNDLENINGFLDWFDEDGAMDYLKDHTSKSKEVMTILDQRFDEIKVEYYVWENQKLIKEEKVMVGIMNQKAFEWIEEGDDIFIRGGTSHLQAIMMGVKQ